MITEEGQTRLGKRWGWKDDRDELAGTGVFIQFGKGEYQGVLTAGHVVDEIQRANKKVGLQDGPYVRISGSPDKGLGKEMIREGALVIRRAGCITWGKTAGLAEEKKGSKPDLGFVWIPKIHREQMEREWRIRFYPWEGQSDRIEKLSKNTIEGPRLCIGLMGERMRREAKNNRTMMIVGVWGEEAERRETDEGWVIWKYGLEGGEGKELVELERGAGDWEQVKREKVISYRGMSGGGTWGTYWEIDKEEPNIKSELEGILFAQGWGEKRSGQEPKELWGLGEETVRTFIDEMVTPTISRELMKESKGGL